MDGARFVYQFSELATATHVCEPADLMCRTLLMMVSIYQVGIYPCMQTCRCVLISRTVDTYYLAGIYTNVS